MEKLHLNNLKLGLPGLTKTAGAFLAEAAAYCLDSQGFKPGVVLKVVGDINKEVAIFWTDKVDEQVKRTWKDSKEAVEYAATAIGILLTLEYTEFIIGERGRQDGVADYILTKRKETASLLNFDSPQAHLEITGILTEKAGNTIEGRLSIKKQKAKKYTKDGQQILIIVTEFSIPKAKIVKI